MNIMYIRFVDIRNAKCVAQDWRKTHLSRYNKTATPTMIAITPAIVAATLDPVSSDILEIYVDPINIKRPQTRCAYPNSKSRQLLEHNAIEHRI